MSTQHEAGHLAEVTIERFGGRDSLHDLMVAANHEEHLRTINHAGEYISPWDSPEVTPTNTPTSE